MQSGDLVPLAYPQSVLDVDNTTSTGSASSVNSAVHYSHHGGAGHHAVSECPVDSTGYAVDDNLQQYWCQEPERVNDTIIDGEYNEGETLKEQ